MKMFQFTLYLGGKEVKGGWREYTSQAFSKDALAFADNDVSFTVEFKEV